MTTERARFDALYRATRTDLLAYLARRAGSADEAADLLAETYLVAWQKLEAIPEGDRARLWLFGVARNLLRRGARRRRVDAALVERLASGLATAQAASAPDEHAQGTLAALLAELPGRDREILTLTAWEDLRPAEIAEVMGISANAVRIRLHRARKRLARRLEPPVPRRPPVLVEPSEPAAG